MYCVKQIAPDTWWIGANDRRMELFENLYPIPNGVSYNSYVVLDDETVLLDTADAAVGGIFLENLAYALGARKLDYIIINHMEPDHSATLTKVLERYPEARVICTARTELMIRQFYALDIAGPVRVVKEGDTLTTGRHTFTFMMAPMVHWPEVMVTYDAAEKILYSADAFGTFGALSGNIFADQLDFRNKWLSEARRYYANIVGKYGGQVHSLLKKAAGLDIGMLCPLHGPIWRSDISWFVEKYMRWSQYAPEGNAVMIAYASMYGHTENAASIIAGKLSDAGVGDISMYDVSSTHPSVLLSEAFRVSHIVLASATHDAYLPAPMEGFLRDMAAHNLQNRVVALVENGSWAPIAGKAMRDILSGCKNITFAGETLSMRSALQRDQLEGIDDLVGALISTITKEAADAEAVGGSAMYALSYGLFVLTAKEGDKDNGCIINTVTQVADRPKRISIAVNKANYTHDMILRTRLFNVSVLSQEAPFALFEHYGFQSGRNVNKFEGASMPRSKNGLCYIEGCTNALISGQVIQALDVGSHTVFIADVAEARTLKSAPSMTYAYYFASVKPKPAPKPEKKKGFVCKICGYIYEGDVLPPDFICPICKHGAEDFERL